MFNRYSYTMNDPMNMWDPDGNFSITFDPTAHSRAAQKFRAGAGQGQVQGAISDFKKNLNEMVETNFVGSDNFFHCQANCQATSRGLLGEAVAVGGSTYRELRQGAADSANGESNPADTAEDVAANRVGRDAGRRDSRDSCAASCSPLAPDGLMTKIGSPELEPSLPPTDDMLPIRESDDDQIIP